ncbi:unnamed protein product [Adineta ricciae]|uniref:N-acetyltransferase domain-containing protein n=1 Tax=Adineta ricciae TaxID=249248 RepID=A0A816CZ52_ADIRI|nr:unnamed protein product [Adineta ricciae]CAF1626500.1 unnamed protein product [Adineta ricciae]
MIGNEEYVYELINDETDARICAQLLADEFVVHEPITRFDKISSKLFFDQISWPWMKHAFVEGLSFLARHRPSGNIVAAIIATDLYLRHKNHPYDASGAPALTPIIDILDEMEDIFIRHDFDQELKPNMVLHIGMGATRADHGHIGVATRLRAVAMDHARKAKEFQYAVVQTTNPVTRHIYLKMGGKILSEIDPNTWIWKKKNCTLYPYEKLSIDPIPNILIKLT